MTRGDYSSRVWAVLGTCRSACSLLSDAFKRVNKSDAQILSSGTTTVKPSRKNQTKQDTMPTTAPEATCPGYVGTPRDWVARDVRWRIPVTFSLYYCSSYFPSFLSL